ncbi:MAG TPA: VOC family protein [Vicinamibacteria bacterium]|nr:VOC family protein [Vicinamibacteria bacterium]
MESLGIRRLESVHYYVHDLERSRRFYTELMDFAEIGGSSEDLTRAGKQKSLAFLAGHCVVVCIEPRGEGGRAWRWLRKHPDGVGTLNFEVEDADKAFRLLEGRGGTPIDDVRRFQDVRGNEIAFFSITTPFGDTTFRFVERRGYQALLPGFEPCETLRGGANRLGFVGFDHVTSNFPTLGHVSLWLEHVMGFERFWEIQFHTADIDPAYQHGSGLRSLVYRDPASGVKFANNEPWRPNFRGSQINVFNEELRGPGVQHLAIAVRDIVACVRLLRERKVEFMPTPATYYDALPERLKRLGIGAIDEDLGVLRDLEILLDGDGPGKYLLQIFLKESSGLYHDPGAGPFFFEIIQRKGDEGFGAGNFRALFESIERAQAHLAPAKG